MKNNNLIMSKFEPKKSPVWKLVSSKEAKSRINLEGHMDVDVFDGQKCHLYAWCVHIRDVLIM